MKPDISIVTAVYNGADFLEKSLPAIFAASDEATEIILVDDGSTDNSVELGRRFGAGVIEMNNRTGAANARNIGVRKAKGEIILFVDADVVIKPDTINELRLIFSRNPHISAAFGSYDDTPGEPDFFSQYRNLMHHFFHQTGSVEAETFWSGFGAVRREVFLQFNGFDAKKFEIPSVEDIELGYRMREKRHRILLVPELQAKHLKKWTFYSILKTDFWQRAVPWVEIMMLYPQVKHDLNAKVSQKLSALLTGIFLLSLLASIRRWEFLAAALGSVLIFLIINRQFYSFFLRRKGLWFTLRVFPMHLLYFIYSSAAFLYSWINVKIMRRASVIR